ncbi:MAG: hypothetical protein M3437_15195 [Chloroflexota bacterium]|nr:hypothetical protein [Chloroflexota bacterium]MDQ5867375.1 hypothetical protein [Chloroflexota bacterium]
MNSGNNAPPFVILNAVKNDKVEALGTVVATIKKGWLILRFDQNDNGATLLLVFGTDILVIASRTGESEAGSASSVTTEHKHYRLNGPTLA